MCSSHTNPLLRAFSPRDLEVLQSIDPANAVFLAEIYQAATSHGVYPRRGVMAGFSAMKWAWDLMIFSTVVPGAQLVRLPFNAGIDESLQRHATPATLTLHDCLIPFLRGDVAREIEIVLARYNIIMLQEHCCAVDWLEREEEKKYRPVLKFIEARNALGTLCEALGTTVHSHSNASSVPATVDMTEGEWTVLSRVEFLLHTLRHVETDIEELRRLANQRVGEIIRLAGTDAIETAEDGEVVIR